MGVTNQQRGRQNFVGGAQIGPVELLAADGAINAKTDGISALTKAGIGAYTLAAPSRAGLVRRIINRTANAHVVTATSLIDDGVTGGSKTTLTFGAFAGACIELVSTDALKWNVQSKNVVTVS